MGKRKELERLAQIVLDYDNLDDAEFEREWPEAGKSTNIDFLVGEAERIARGGKRGRRKRKIERLRGQRQRLLNERFVDKAVLRSTVDFCAMVKDALRAHFTDDAVLRKQYAIPDDSTVAGWLHENADRIREMAHDAAVVRGEWRG